MCLDMRFKLEVEKKMIAKLPDGLITVYRWVRKVRGGYTAVWSDYRFRVGVNTIHPSKSCGRKHIRGLYKPGFHSCKTRAGAMEPLVGKRNESILVKFQMRKEWVTAIGKNGRSLVYVTDRIISPSLRDKSAVVE